MGRMIFPILVLALAIIACCSPCTPPLTEPVSPAPVILPVYFTDMARYQVGTEPYETAGHAQRAGTRLPAGSDPDPIIPRSHRSGKSPGVGGRPERHDRVQ